MDRLTIADIASLRAKSEPLPTSVNAYSSSDMFKSARCSTKPDGRALQHQFSNEARDFTGSALKKSVSHQKERSMISLGVGRPTVDFYPWHSVTIRAHPGQPEGQVLLASGSNVDSHSITINKRGGPYDLARGLNYGHAAGSPALLRFVTEHVELIHNPPYQDWGACLCSGSTSALETALRIFCNRGDTVLTERYTYPGLIEASRLLGLQTFGIDMDAEGLLPSHLEQTLHNWPNNHQSSTRPKLLYTIPTGQNPTGCTQPLHRKKAIYQIAQQHDILIIEDDPYYFLQTSPSLSLSHTTHPSPPTYLTSLPQSYLSLDTTSRVIRLDSLSKLLAPGLRCGWIVAAESIISKFIAYAEVSTVSVSGPTQLMLWELFEARWGHEGFVAWLEALSVRYRARLELMLGACERYLPACVCTWVRPGGGMFLWVKVDLGGSLGRRGLGSGDLETRILQRARANGVLITVGSLFDTREVPDEMELRFRLTYAAAEEGEIEEGVRQFSNAIREELGMDAV